MWSKKQKKTNKKQKKSQPALKPEPYLRAIKTQKSKQNVDEMCYVNHEG